MHLCSVALYFIERDREKRGDYSMVEPNCTCSAMECIIWYVRYSWPMGVFLLENLDTDCRPHLCYLMTHANNRGGVLQRDINAWPTEVSYFILQLIKSSTFRVTQNKNTSTFGILYFFFRRFL